MTAPAPWKWKWQAMATVLLAVAFYAFCPVASVVSRPFLDQAEAVTGHLTPGDPSSGAPASFTWIAYPLGLALEAARRSDGSGSPAIFESRVGLVVAHVLRLLWSILAALVVVMALRLLRLLARSTEAEPGPAEWAPVAIGRPGQISAGVLVILLLSAPALTLSVRGLFPALPAALLLLLAAGELAGPLGKAAVIRMGLIAGALLAWFPFAWPAVPLLLLALILRRDGAPSILIFLTLALFLGLVLEPSHILHPGRILPGMAAGWRREGGWSGPGGSGLLGLLSLSAWIGPAAWAFCMLGILFVPLRGKRSVALFLGGLWLSQILLPALTGVRRPGGAQIAIAPLAAVWSSLALVSWPAKGRGRRVLAAALAVALAASCIPQRIALETRARRGASLDRSAWTELAGRIGPRTLWLADRTSGAAPADCGAGGLLERGLILPRDSRNPGRYDFSYWPRWYAGFQWVLLSSARVKENLTRPGAAVPQAFYRALESQGTLEREWGRGDDAGLRLYRLDEGSGWHRPLTADELRLIDGGPNLTWFISELGGLYLDAGDLPTAELLFRQGTEWDPHAAGLYNNLGAVYLRRGDLEEAGRAFEEGLKQSPNSVELLLNLARACSGEKLYPRAEGLLRRVITLRPEYPDAHYELGRVFMAQGKDDQARRAFTHYLELDPQTTRRPQIEAALQQLLTTPAKKGRP
jgi:hypothetical protein